MEDREILNEIEGLRTIEGYQTLQEVIDRDIPGWRSLISHPNFPELVLWLQAQSIGFSKVYTRKDLYSEEDIRKALRSKYFSHALEWAANKLVQARNDLFSINEGVKKDDGGKG